MATELDKQFNAKPRNREEEAAKAHARAIKRFGPTSFPAPTNPPTISS